MERRSSNDSSDGASRQYGITRSDDKHGKRRRRKQYKRCDGNARAQAPSEIPQGSKYHFAMAILDPICSKFIALVMSVLAIFQFFWIRRLQDGLKRVQNDPWDIVFQDDAVYYPKPLHRTDPKLWKQEQQDFISEAIPVPVHSHNDYWRSIPLFEALGSGCISVEADVHLHESQLLVGHSSLGLNDKDTLRSMYLEPLQRMIEMRQSDPGDWRGLYNEAPKQTITLLIDVKTTGEDTLKALEAQLQPLRDADYLTYWNGTARIMRPLTIVASGNTPFSGVMALNSTHRDIFWDAKLEQLPSVEDKFDVDPPSYRYNPSNSYFASTRFHNGRLWSASSQKDLALLDSSSRDFALSQIDQAKARGLTARYWDTPTEPANLREIAWRVLVKLRVGILNMDDLGTVRARAAGWGRVDLE